MKLDPVEGSSNIKAIGYDPETRVMRVQFHNGKKFDYGEVKGAAFEAFAVAKSKGSHFHRYIRSSHLCKPCGEDE